MLGTVLTAAVATFFAGMGLLGLARPARLMAMFEVALTSALGRNEVRAVYGGFGLAVSAALVASLRWSGERALGVRLAIAAALAGMAVGRLIGFLFERPKAFYPVGLFLCVELAMASALVLPWR